MGQKNPDRIPIAYWRQSIETVDDMLRERWDVITRCHSCGLMMGVDLALVIRVAGPHTSLWNRRQRCRRIGCQGFVEFQGRPRGVSVYATLSAP